MRSNLLRSGFSIAAISLGAVALVATLAVPAIRHWREHPPDPPRPIRSKWMPSPTVVPGAGADYPFGLAISRDGRHLVYPATRGGSISLWLDDLTSGASKPLPFTDAAVSPFWSADGTRVGFFADGKVRAIDLSSGGVADLAKAASPRGGAWNTAGEIVYAPEANSGLWIRRVDGSEQPLTTLDSAAGETAHEWPALLADGRHVVFLVRAQEASRAGLWLTSTDNGRDRVRLASAESQAIVTGDTLLFSTSEALMAQRFDAQTSRLVGRSELVGLPVGSGPLDQLFATASGDVVIFGPPGSSLRDLQWFDRSGHPLERAGEPTESWDFRLSPDGKRIALTTLDPQVRSLDVWVREELRPVPQRLSLSIEADAGGVWSPDGARVAWIAARRRVTIRSTGAGLPERVVATFAPPLAMWDWSSDGKWLVIGRSDPDTQDDLWLQPEADGATARVYAKIPFNQIQGAVSPDGRWIAYASDESGKHDIYVDTFPTAGKRSRLTTGGGLEPRWSKEKRVIYFRRGTEIHVIALAESGGKLEAQSTNRLFDAGANIRAYDVSADGTRFLLNVPAGSSSPGPPTMVAHWKK
jgi:Tol biopolymer transport system component